MQCGLFLGFKHFSGSLVDGLIEMKTQEGVFVGKKVGALLDKEALFNTAAHICSLLQKKDARIPVKEISLTLFPYHE